MNSTDVWHSHGKQGTVSSEARTDVHLARTHHLTNLGEPWSAPEASRESRTLPHRSTMPRLNDHRTERNSQVPHIPHALPAGVTLFVVAAGLMLAGTFHDEGWKLQNWSLWVVTLAAVLIVHGILARLLCRLTQIIAMFTHDVDHPGDDGDDCDVVNIMDPRRQSN